MRGRAPAARSSERIYLDQRRAARRPRPARAPGAAARARRSAWPPRRSAPPSAASARACSSRAGDAARGPRPPRCSSSTPSPRARARRSWRRQRPIVAGAPVARAPARAPPRSRRSPRRGGRAGASARAFSDCHGFQSGWTDVAAPGGPSARRPRAPRSARPSASSSSACARRHRFAPSDCVLGGRRLRRASRARPRRVAGQHGVVQASRPRAHELPVGVGAPRLLQPSRDSASASPASSRSPVPSR